MFASKTPRDLNHDPLPWHCPGADEKYRIPDGFELECDVYAPRPEFDHVQHNPVNPILDLARDYARPRFISQSRAASVLIRAWNDLLTVEDATPEQQDHARAVLTRLANLARTEAR